MEASTEVVEAFKSFHGSIGIIMTSTEASSVEAFAMVP